MTTTVTVKTYSHPAIVRQIAPVRFNGSEEVPAIEGVPVPVPADSEATFYVHDALDILVTEGPARVQDGASYFHGIWNDSRFASGGYVKADKPRLIGE